MDSSNRYSFGGILTDAFQLPGFIVPVFVQNNKYYVQIIDEETDVIRAFQYLDLVDNDLQPVGQFPMGEDSEIDAADSVYGRRIGDQGLYALRFPSMDVVLLEGEGIKELLQNRIKDFDEFPATQKSLAIFTDDANLVKSVSRKIERESLKRKREVERSRDIASDLVERARKNELGNIGTWLRNAASKEPKALAMAFDNLRINREDDFCKEEDFCTALVSSFDHSDSDSVTKTTCYLVHVAGISRCSKAIPRIINEIEKTAESDVDGASMLVDAISSYPSDELHGILRDLLENESLPRAMLPTTLSLLSNRDDYVKYFEKYTAYAKQLGGTQRLLKVL